MTQSKFLGIFEGTQPKLSTNYREIYLIGDFNFIEITLRHGCSLNLQHIFRATFLKNTYGWLLLKNLDSFTK